MAFADLSKPSVLSLINNTFTVNVSDKSIKGVFCFSYADVKAQKLVLHLKMNRIASVLMFCAKHMEIAYRELDIHGDVLFVNIPRSKKGMIKYGFDQGKELAKAICERIPNSKYFDLIGRKGRTSEQKNLSAKEREINVKGKFKLKNTIILRDKPKNIVIVDDVYTTGSSLAECAKILCAHYPESKIYALLLARNKINYT